MDFRTQAAEATTRQLQNAGHAVLSELGDSGCVPVPGGRSIQYWIELPCLALSTGCMLFTLGTLLTFMGILSEKWVLPLLSIVLAISLTFRKAQAFVLKTYLSRRPDSFLKLFAGLPARVLALEDAATYRKTKIVVEDDTVCLLDSERRRLLIEGCCYRYVIYAKDVYSIGPVSGYALSGARLHCRVAGQNFEVVLVVRGHGPIASLVQSFSPSTDAEGLASTLNRTLFGVATAAYKQNALPPALPIG
jgi:hypothetical protein